MSVSCFVDTNVLVYAHDRSGGEKHRVALELLSQLWEARTAALSTQVLQELYVNLRKKAGHPLPPEEVRLLIADYLRWEVIVNTGDSLLEAIEIESRYGIAFWDALIVQAANASGADVLYSEDLGDGQSYGTVRVVNPFRA
jgi:predicted nucleic acid-binding protein